MRMEDIAVGDYVVSIRVEDVEDANEHALEIVATCGETERRHRATIAPSTNTGIDELKLHLAQEAAKLAEDAAGREHSRLLKKNFLGG